MTELTPFDEGYVAPPAPEPRPEPAKAEPKRERPKASASGIPKVEPAAKPKADHPTDVADGVYFTMPAEAYHRVERVSTSGIQRMLVSPAEFWADSWLNHDRIEEDGDTPARLIGRAYHTAQLEPHLFGKLYAREPQRADYPAERACWTGTDIERELKGLGLPSSTGSVADKAARLEAAGYSGTIFPLEVERWRAELGDRTPLAAKVWREIEVDGKRLRQSPEIAALLTGGAAEVSVFWTDEKGVKLKCRFDYLRATGWTDFKTFDPKGKPLEQAIPDAIRYNRYYVQAAMYQEAAERIQAGELPIQGETEPWEHELIAALRMNPEAPECWYVFQQKGGVPNIIGRRFHFSEVPLASRINEAGASAEGIERHRRAVERPTQLYRKALVEIRRAKRLFQVYSEVYEPGEAWLPIKPLGEVSDDDFSPHWLEAE
jgi:hypothetical protein